MQRHKTFFRLYFFEKNKQKDVVYAYIPLPYYAQQLGLFFNLTRCEGIQDLPY